MGKSEPVCPKCKSTLDLTKTNLFYSEPKKPAKPPAEKNPDPLVQAEELAATETEDNFESPEELADDEEDVVEDLEVDDETPDE
jgi:hypothetical protein